MIYRNLNDISLYTFNKILLGDKNAIIIKREKETDDEIKHTCEQLISEYSLILGNENARAVCMLYESAINEERQLLIAKSGLAMIGIDMEIALEASRYLGYNGDEDKVEEFLKRAEREYTQRYERSRIAIERYAENKKEQKPITERDLANERAALMMAGIPIDQHKISAMEYACVLKSKMDEIKAQKQALRK